MKRVWHMLCTAESQIIVIQHSITCGSALGHPVLSFKGWVSLALSDFVARNSRLLYVKIDTLSLKWHYFRRQLWCPHDLYPQMRLDKNVSALCVSRPLDLAIYVRAEGEYVEQLVELGVQEQVCTCSSHSRWGSMHGPTLPLNCHCIIYFGILWAWEWQGHLARWGSGLRLPSRMSILQMQQKICLFY